MKITEIAIFDHKQFKEFVVDLTYPQGHPKAGQPLEKVCFIGSNGTGKTTILEILDEQRYTKFKIGKGIAGFAISSPADVFVRIGGHGVSGEWWKYMDYSKIKKLQKESGKKNKNTYDFTNREANDFPGLGVFLAANSKRGVKIFSPSESHTNNSLKITDNFDVNLSESLEFFNKGVPFNHEVSDENVKEFWKILTYQVKKREDDYQKFLKKEENRAKTVAEVEADFDENNPKILDKLAELWNKILAKAGLEFDAEGASNPVQLTDNLKAYIRLKSNKQLIPYNELSTGIRNFIFKIGHIYSLYFNRNIESGFLMIDEPENSLFPDFLYDLIDIYKQITQNTQIFVATHSPIVAAQFEPSERVILDFDDEGFVTARRGIVPIGDDPNDILVKDFGIRSLLGKEGVEKWERFIELKMLIKHSQNKDEKSDWIDEYMKIGRDYNFPVNALS